MEEIRSNSKEDCLEKLVEAWKQIGADAIEKRGSFSVALSGGSTPKALYQMLAKTDWAWSATKMYLGDERSVPATDPDSNYKMAYESFHPLKIQLERWKTEAHPFEAAAEDYEKLLKRDLHNPPRFDLILLGIGDDGHTASLFPGTKGLDEEEKLCIVNWVPQMNTQRLTFTYPMIKLARNVWFLAGGEKKAPWIEKMIAGDRDSCPAARIECEASAPKIYSF